jgi:hypothetical protein
MSFFFILDTCDSIYYFNFPVVYLPNDPTRSRILLKIEDYQKYNVPIPDTLVDVLVHYFNCDYEVVRRPGKPAKIIKVKHEWFRFFD